MKKKEDFGLLARLTWDFHQGSRNFLNGLFYTLYSSVFLLITRLLVGAETWDFDTSIYVMLGNAMAGLGISNGLDKLRDITSKASETYAKIESKEKGIDLEDSKESGK